jgi:hypothetical protein
MDIVHPPIVVIGKRRYRKNNNMISRDVDNQVIAPYKEDTEEMFFEKSCDILASYRMFYIYLTLAYTVSAIFNFYFD